MASFTIEEIRDIKDEVNNIKSLNGKDFEIIDSIYKDLYNQLPNSRIGDSICSKVKQLNKETIRMQNEIKKLCDEIQFMIKNAKIKS